VLAAHALAYLLAREPNAGVHGYLSHAPQVIGIAGLLGLFALGVAAQPARPPAMPFLVVAASTFALQEHLERYAHSGHWPFLVASPFFLIGLALQIPVALAVWVVVRWLVGSPSGRPTSRPPRLAFVPVSFVPAAVVRVPRVLPAVASARGPPSAS
jgi:hypothetical protein